MKNDISVLKTATIFLPNFLLFASYNKNFSKNTVFVKGILNRHLQIIDNVFDLFQTDIQSLEKINTKDIADYKKFMADYK